MRVIKIGGNELSDPGFLAKLARDVRFLRVETAVPVIIVHGGGRAIAGMQAQLGLEPVKVDGLRITDKASLRVAEMVLSGQSNKLIVKALLNAGVDALGLSGVDGGILRAQKKQHPQADLGYVGEIVEVRADLLMQLVGLGVTAVLSPISLGLDGLTYNVNADEAAAAVAEALHAEQLDFISNVPGVLSGNDVVPYLTPQETQALIADGTISGGMIPKVSSALNAIARGVPQARIVNLASLITDGGTIFADNEGWQGHR